MKRVVNKPSEVECIENEEQSMLKRNTVIQKYGYPGKIGTIWDFVGKIKATGSAEEERESMIEAAVAHAIDEDEEA
jgi:hypothetical protein